MEAFVYVWENLTNGKRYVGYHKGEVDDGYVCSSHSDDFWNDFNDENMKWRRSILFEGTSDDCLKFEQNILSTVDLLSDSYYNNARGASIIFTDDVRKKKSISAKRYWDSLDENDPKEQERRRKIGNANRGNRRPDLSARNQSLKGKSFDEIYGTDGANEIKQKQADSRRGQHYHTDEWKSELSDRMKGNEYGTHQSEEARQRKRELWNSELNPGRNKSKEHLRKISESKKGKPAWNRGKKRKIVKCPHCEKSGGVGVMNRWHFDNCKLKNGKEENK